MAYLGGQLSIDTFFLHCGKVQLCLSQPLVLPIYNEIIYIQNGDFYFISLLYLFHFFCKMENCVF